ncbi:MAG: tetratricopeptide repeat protein, partial [Chthoniobacterales bacterium]
MQAAFLLSCSVLLVLAHHGGKRFQRSRGLIYSRVIEKDSKRVAAYTNRGAALAVTGKLEAALTDLSKAISLNPLELNAYINRAKVRIMQGEFHGAIKECDQALRIAPQNEVALQLRASA